MISDNKIKDVLQWIKRRYDEAGIGDVDEANLYSKLATLELSCWVEDSLKDLVLELVDKKLDNENAKEKFKKTIQNRGGFEYERHFLYLLNRTIGFINREVVEKEICSKDYDKLQKFKNALDSLSISRNFHAHNFSHNHRRVHEMSDPSSMISFYNDIAPGLEIFKEEIAKNQSISF